MTVLLKDIFIINWLRGLIFSHDRFLSRLMKLIMSFFIPLRSMPLKRLGGDSSSESPNFFKPCVSGFK